MIHFKAEKHFQRKKKKSCIFKGVEEPESFFQHCNRIKYQFQAWITPSCDIWNVGTRHKNISEHTSSTAAGIPRWIYHVSQLLHHTLHHLRLILQQLRWKLLIQPSLVITESNTTVGILVTVYQVAIRVWLQASYSISLIRFIILLTSAYFFQFSDQLSRSHDIFLTVV